MRKFNLFSLIFFFVIAYALAHNAHRHRSCPHSQTVEPKLKELVRKIKSIPMETHRMVNNLNETMINILNKKKTVIKDKPKPMRIKVDYQLGNLDPERSSFVKDLLIPVVVGYFQKILNVRRPVEGNLFLPSFCIQYFTDYPEYCTKVTDECGSAKHNPTYMGDHKICSAPFDRDCDTIPGGPGAPDTDFVLYVTAANDDTCSHSSAAVGSGGFCLLDLDNWYGSLNRPLAGFANLCPNHISTAPEDFGDLVDTTVHEIFHALLLSHELIDHYVDLNNVKIEKVVDDGSLGIFVITPNVLRVTREMFNCDIVDGAGLENDGGDGTANSHWERRQFLGELMVGNSVTATRDIISDVTFALAEDSGWYVPNYEFAGIIPESHHRGCGYLTNNCLVPSTELENVYCWPNKVQTDNVNLCTFDALAVGYCNTNIGLLDNCNLVLPYNNMDCTNPDHAVKSSIDIGTRNKIGARCYPMASTNLNRTDGRYMVWRSKLGATCFDTICKDGQVYLKFEETNYNPAAEVRCPTGQLVDLTKLGLGFTEGLVGPCPDNESICNAWGCPNDCSGEGDCYKGKCYCHVGFFGKKCKNFACGQNGACPGDSVCDTISGLCIDNLVATTTTTTTTKQTTKAPTITQPAVAKPVPKPVVPKVTPPPPPPPPPPPSPKSIPLVIRTTPKVYTGKASSAGYLAGCKILFQPLIPSQVLSIPATVVTNFFGTWEMKTGELGYVAVDPDSGNSCWDILTGANVRWSLRAPIQVKYINPITTLAVIKEDLTKWVVSGTYKFDANVMKAIGLNDGSVLFRDFVKKVYEGSTGYDEHAVLVSTVISNTVSQVAAFMTGRKFDLEIPATQLMSLLYSDFEKSKYTIAYLTDPKTVETIITGLKTNQQSKDIKKMANIVSHANKLAFDFAKKYNGKTLLKELSKLSYLVQTYLVYDATKLHKELAENAVPTNSEKERFSLYYRSGIDLLDLVYSSATTLDSDIMDLLNSEYNISMPSAVQEPEGKHIFITHTTMVLVACFLTTVLVVITYISLKFKTVARKYKTENLSDELLVAG